MFAGYPCITAAVRIITPYKNSQSTDQKRFNTAHSRARLIVECAFGILKTRCRNSFNRDLELSIENFINTIFAAVVLHNICVLKDGFDPNMLYRKDAAPIDDEIHSVGVVMPDSNDGLRIRDEMLSDFVVEQNLI